MDNCIHWKKNLATIYFLQTDFTVKRVFLGVCYALFFYGLWGVSVFESAFQAEF
jgi:hypothetical protein